jgi:hypothetical protein
MCMACGVAQPPVHVVMERGVALLTFQRSIAAPSLLGAD